MGLARELDIDMLESLQTPLANPHASEVERREANSS